MTETGDLTIPLPDRLDVARHLVVITRFLAAICWLGVLVMLGMISGGALLLLGVPLVITAVAFWAARYQRERIFYARGAGLERTIRGKDSVSPPALGKTVMFPVYYAAALSWVVAAAVVFNGSNAVVLLTALPLIVTFAAYAANKRLKRLHAENSA